MIRLFICRVCREMWEILEWGRQEGTVVDFRDRRNGSIGDFVNFPLDFSHIWPLLSSRDDSLIRFIADDIQKQIKKTEIVPQLQFALYFNRNSSSHTTRAMQCVSHARGFVVQCKDFASTLACSF